MRLTVNRIAPLATLALLSACGGGASVADVPLSAPNGPAADYPMVLGAPFVVDGLTYTPADTLNYDTVGYAAVGSDGAGAITGAHRTLPLPSYVEVTSLESGKTILVRLERRGPTAGPELVELSPGAAAQLGLSASGHAAVRVRRVNPPEAERALLRTGQPAPARMDTPWSLLTVLQRKLDQKMGIVTPATAPEPLPTATPAPPAPPKPVAKPVEAKPAVAVRTMPAVTAKPRPVEPAKPASAPAKPHTTVKSATSGGSFVQVAAFSSKANAEAAAGKLGGSVVQVGKLWRVRLGPLSTADKVKAALAKAKAAGYSDARIQHAN